MTTISSGASKITANEKTVDIDPEVFFHRICALKENDEEMRDYLMWELSPYPRAYFDAFGMLKNKKSELCTICQKSFINIRDPMRSGN